MQFPWSSLNGYDFGTNIAGAANITFVALNDKSVLRSDKHVKCKSYSATVHAETTELNMNQVPTQTNGDTPEASDEKCPSVQALEYELAFLVRRLEAVRRRNDFELERAHYLLLLLLEKEDGQSVGSLAEQVNLDASTVTRQIAAMQHSGLVDKQPNPDDRRGGFMTLTDKGREAIARTRQLRLERVERSFHGWKDSERLEFARLMSYFNSQLSHTLNEPQS